MALISLCHRADRRDNFSRFACIVLVNQHQPAFDSLHFQLASNRLFLDYMAEPAGELLPLPPVAAELLANPEPPANLDPPAEPLAEPAAQPAAPNQVISSFWCISFVLSFSYPLYDAFRVFYPTFGLFGFSLQVLLVPCLAYQRSTCPWGILCFPFSPPFVGVVRTCVSLCSVLSVLACFSLHCARPFGSEGFFRLGLYSLHSAPGADFVCNEIFFVCVYGPGPFGSGSRVLFKSEF